MPPVEGDGKCSNSKKEAMTRVDSQQCNTTNLTNGVNGITSVFRLITVEAPENGCISPPNVENDSTPSLPNSCTVGKDQSKITKSDLTNGWVDNSVNAETENASPLIDVSNINGYKPPVNGDVSPNAKKSSPKKKQKTNNARSTKPAQGNNLEGEGAVGGVESPSEKSTKDFAQIKKSKKCSSIKTESLLEKEAKMKDACATRLALEENLELKGANLKVEGATGGIEVASEDSNKGEDVQTVQAVRSWCNVDAAVFVPRTFMADSYLHVVDEPHSYSEAVLMGAEGCEIESGDWQPSAMSNDVSNELMDPALCGHLNGDLPEDVEAYNHVDDSEASTSSQFLVPSSDPLMVYEFELLPADCGRLISKDGHFVKKLRTEVGVLIAVEGHPFNSEKSICRIRGSEIQIQESLERIRKRFPIRQFPHLTLKQTNVLAEAVITPKALSLPERVHVDVLLSSTISAGHFFLHQPTNVTYYELDALQSDMCNHYDNLQTPMVDEPKTGDICVARTLETWLRVEIIEVLNDGQECICKFLDYGGFSTFSTSQLRKICVRYLALPFQATECFLADVEPVGGVWSEGATMLFQSMTTGHFLQCYIVCYVANNGKTAPAVRLFWQSPVRRVCINDLMVENGFAISRAMLPDPPVQLE